MSKRIVTLLLFIALPIMSFAESESNKTKTVTMSALDAVKMAGNMVQSGNLDTAQQILTKMPETKSLPVEIERWYLLAQIEQKKGNIDGAIKIYRKILDDQPDLVKIRYELALCYMAKEQWYRADYHLRLALSGNDIPEEIKKRMLYLRYVARKNKNWNVWFNFGAAPDSNVNQAAGGIECISWGGFYGCTQNQDPEKAVGFNLSLGGNYEFKLSEHWRIKSDAMVYSNTYDKDRYDDLYLAASTGPRYVWENGDVWLAAIANRRWYGWERYNWGLGGKLDFNYDLTRRLSFGVLSRVTNNSYDEYGDILDGQTYNMIPHIAYSFDATKYLVLRGNLERETAKIDAYANRKYGFSVGVGSELLYGFRVYLEPYFSWINYDGEKFAVKDGLYQPVREKDFLQRYSVSLSNNKLEIWGFVPTLTFSYTKKDSNIHAREYDKYTTEFSFQQRF